jgi:hypothetical protein
MVEMQEAFITPFGARKVDVATPAILNNPFRRRTMPHRPERNAAINGRT